MSLRVDDLQLDVLTVDPSSPPDGSVWYRSDIGKLRGRQSGASVNLVSGAGDFGVDFNYQEALAEQTETGTTYIEKFLATTPSLIGGAYRVGLSMETKTDNTNRPGNVRIVRDGSTTIFENTGIIRTEYFPRTIFLNGVLSAGVHTFSFQIRKDPAVSQGATISIRNMRFELWMV